MRYLYIEILIQMNKQAIKQQLVTLLENTFQKRSKDQVARERKSMVDWLLANDYEVNENHKEKSQKRIVITVAGTNDDRVETLRDIADKKKGVYISSRSSSVGGVVFDSGIEIITKPAPKTGESNVDDVREASVGVMVLSLLQGNKTQEQHFDFVRKLATEGHDKLVISAKLGDVCHNILNKRATYNNAIKNATGIVNEFGDKLRRYEIHVKSKLSEHIREIGKKLSGYAYDKWNPSDIYFIIPNINVDQYADDIVRFNEFISEDQSVIGVSLKDERAQHGKLALNSYAKLFSVSDRTYKGKHTKFDEQYTRDLIKQLKTLKTAKNVKIYLVVPKGIESVSETIELNEKISHDPDAKMSVSYLNSMYVTLEFLNDHVNELDDVAVKLYNGCSSRLPYSCSHSKVQGGKFERIQGMITDVKLNAIYIPLVKETQVLMDVIVADGTHHKLQSRTFTTRALTPQFNLLKSKYNPNTKRDQVILLSQADSFLK